jgi:hypothetical protein
MKNNLIEGDAHVHVPYIKDGTSRTVNAAIARGLDFIVLAYHIDSWRFDEFLTHPQLPEGSDMMILPGKNEGSIAKITYEHEGDQRVFYAIKGHELKYTGEFFEGDRQDMQADIIAWPIGKEIDPQGKCLYEILMEMKSSGSLITASHSKGDMKGLLKKMQIYADCFEYSCAPKMFTRAGNDAIESAAKAYSIPLIGGTDSRWPGRARPVTRIIWNPDNFVQVATTDEFVSEMSRRMKSKDLMLVSKEHTGYADFAAQYVAYFMAAMKKHPAGTLKSFLRSHIV